MFLSIEGDNEYWKELGLLLCTSQNINFFGEIEILKNKILKWLKMRLKTQSISQIPFVPPSLLTQQRAVICFRMWMRLRCAEERGLG